MKRELIFIALMCMFSVSVFAQKQVVSGVVRDSANSETIVGANVFVKGTTYGAVSDINGNYSLSLDKGAYTLQISFVGYNTTNKSIVVGDKPLKVNINLKSDLQLEEVEVVGDIAKIRETPVAFTTILPARIEERLSGQDIPMILNKTPGVYATQQGGGDGDARVTIRGFSQRNVAVMLDGVPVNDMENGWVYWSNWFGLDAVTRSIQVQRGLGASKLALPSVGGTMNITTKGIETKRQISVEQGVDLEGKLTTNLGYTSGKLKNGWGVTLAGAMKQGNGWVDQTSVKAWFFYTKIDKSWKNHITSLTAFGAPQTHKMRSYKKSIADYDTAYAKELGVKPEDFPKIINKGIGYNAHWGYIKRDAEEWNAEGTARVIDPNAERKALNEMVNTYFKPQFSLRDIWNVNNRLMITNIAYLSIGTGGGIQPRTSLKPTNLISPSDYENNPGLYTEDEIGQINWQSIYNQNTKLINTGFGKPIPPVDSAYSWTLCNSKNYLVQNNNNHFWYGLLSTFNYKLNNEFTLSGGVDLRSYKAEHYSEIVDLIGGDYAIDKADLRNNYDADSSLAMKRVGDKVNYYYDGLVNWGGVFGLLEYKVGKISTFVNLTTNLSGYKKVDYFGNRESDWKYKPGFTFKTGANYNLSEHSNVFFNLGYLSKTKDFKYYFKGFTATFQPDSLSKNETVKAFELGYSYNSRRFTANINAYVTKWNNKPTNQIQGKFTDPITGNEKYTYGDIPGMDALHTGIELDFIYKVLPTLDFQGLVSIGNWIWDKKVDNVQMYFTDNNQQAYTFSFDARGIHVGDAAQSQLGGSLRYEPIKGLYFEGGATFFDRYYADFNPEESTDADGNAVDSWMMPAYTLVDLHAGYRFKIQSLKKVNFTIRFNVLNMLNSVYISDSKNNDTYIQNSYKTFDARSASVFMGAGTQMTTSLKISFE
ncbi:MAG: TonB-dependent receptor [Bacteroidetes bacterium]|nr:TonB-dependent receptor [Bacteroidota bacterium]